ncbi:ATP-binding protein [uncultured Cellulomonas sp.]|uniref:ATP-binding protein n=1 Tax=uncultured Cellulomonas sp. TaxID=189682 RepID=UPI002626746F|nr:ATP-binding protein [uncultured Cellulomonas sp.]
MPLTLAPVASSVRVGRRWVLDQAATAGVQQPAMPTIELLTSEVLTNAIVHGSQGHPVVLHTCLNDDLFGVAVTDQSPDQPRRLQPAPTAGGGRGVLLVDLLATDWGCQALDPSGKSVWFLLSVRT